MFLCTDGTIYQFDLTTQGIALLELPFTVQDVCISGDSTEIVALSKPTSSGGDQLDADASISHIFFFDTRGTRPHRTVQMAGVTGIRPGFNRNRLLCLTANAVVHLDLSGTSPVPLYRFPDEIVSEPDRTEVQGNGFYGISPDGSHFLRSQSRIECWPEDILTGNLQGVSRALTPAEQQQYGIGRH